MPSLSAGVAGTIAVGSLASALTPNLAARAGILPAVFHALAVPASAALALTALFLAKRRRRAWRLALALLAGLGALHALKGFDVEEAALSWGAAGLLWVPLWLTLVRRGDLDHPSASGGRQPPVPLARIPRASTGG